MTDITDQDRRVAHEWATTIGKQIAGHPDARTAARVILATVDAPEPTLTDEIRGLPDFTMSGENCINDCHERADTLATRVAQMEHDLAEARAEVERLTAVAEDYARRATAALTERDEAHAEVERLDAERLDRNPETKARVEAALNNLDKAETVPVQKGEESNAETPDHADVKPGEAWIVECRGERRTAVKDKEDPIPWNTVNADGWSLYEDDEDITLITRLVPAPRVITNPDELNRAKRCTIILDSVGVVCERASLGDGWFTTQHGTDQTPYIELPATVLWEPGA